MGRSPLLRYGAPRANSQLRGHFRRFNQPCYGLALWGPVQSTLIGCRVAGVPLRNRNCGARSERLAKSAQEATMAIFQQDQF